MQLNNIWIRGLIFLRALVFNTSSDSIFTQYLYLLDGALVSGLPAGIFTRFTRRVRISFGQKYEVVWEILIFHLRHSTLGCEETSQGRNPPFSRSSFELEVCRLKNRKQEKHSVIGICPPAFPLLLSCLWEQSESLERSSSGRDVWKFNDTAGFFSLMLAMSAFRYPFSRVLLHFLVRFDDCSATMWRLFFAVGFHFLSSTPPFFSCQECFNKPFCLVFNI